MRHQKSEFDTDLGHCSRGLGFGLEKAKPRSKSADMFNWKMQLLYFGHFIVSHLLILSYEKQGHWPSTVLFSGENKPEHTRMLFHGPVETEESIPGPKNVSICTGMVVMGPQ